MPGPLPGYRRDPDPEGRWDEADGDDRQFVPVRMRTEWNLPLIATLLAFLMFGLPISLVLWSWWWPW